MDFQTVLDSLSFEGLDWSVLWVGLGFVGLLGLLYLALRKQRQALHSGRLLVEEEARREGDLWVVETSLRLSEAHDWCRISLQFSLRYSVETSIHLGERELSNHAFHLELFDREGRRLLAEERPLSEVAVIGTHSAGSSISFSLARRREGRLESDGCPILDFVPPGAGEYRLYLSLPVEARSEGFTVTLSSRVGRLGLTVREGVVPLPRRGYPHRKVDLRP